MPTHAAVQAYYGQELGGSADLKTNACCDAEALPAWMKPLLGRIHPEVTNRYYGCGLVCPPLLEGCKVLDLGCGSGPGRLPALPAGRSAGARWWGSDMTREQLAIAQAHADRTTPSSSATPMCSFLEGTIEQLQDLPLGAGQFDVIVSNCVLNLATDKGAVLRGVKRLLKPGGEFYFADVYADRRLPAALRNDPRALRRMPGRGPLLERLSAPGPGQPGSPIPAWWTTDQITFSRSAYPGTCWATPASFLPPIACSISMAWRMPAKTMARR